MGLELVKPLPIISVVFALIIPGVCVVCDASTNFEEHVGYTEKRYKYCLSPDLLKAKKEIVHALSCVSYPGLIKLLTC